MAQPSASVAWHKKPEQVTVEVTHSVFGYIDQGSCRPLYGTHDLTELHRKKPDSTWKLKDTKNIPAGCFPAMNIVCKAPGLLRIPNARERVLEEFKNTFPTSLNSMPKAELIMCAQISESCIEAQFYPLDHSMSALMALLAGTNRIIKKKTCTILCKDISKEGFRTQLIARKSLLATGSFPSSATDGAPAFTCFMAYGSRPPLLHIDKDKKTMQAKNPGENAILVLLKSSDYAFTPLQYKELGQSWSQDAYFPPALSEEIPAMAIYCKFSQRAAESSPTGVLFDGIYHKVRDEYDNSKVGVLFDRELMPGNILCIQLTSNPEDIGEMVKMANAIHARSSPATLPPAYAAKAYEAWMTLQHMPQVVLQFYTGNLKPYLRDQIFQSAQSFYTADCPKGISPPILALYGVIDQAQELEARKFIVPDSVLSMQHASEKPEHDAWKSLAQSVPASKYPTIVFAFSIQADDVEELVQKQGELQESCVKAIAGDAPEESMFRATQSSISPIPRCAKGAAMVMICSRREGADVARSFFENAAKIMRGETPVTI